MKYYVKPGDPAIPVDVDHMGDHREPAELRADLAACREALADMVECLPGGKLHGTGVYPRVERTARALLARLGRK